jgi:hypothetical protein
MRRVSLSVGSAVVLLGLSIGTGAASAASSKGSPTRFFHGPTISKVKFKGTVGNPTVTITGQRFPLLDGGQSIPGDCGGATTGENYGDFDFIDNTSSWAAGSTTNNGSGATCVGIVVSKSTSTHIVFTFGNAYGESDWVLCGGDGYTVDIETASKSGTVSSIGCTG